MAWAPVIQAGISALAAYMAAKHNSNNSPSGAASPYLSDISGELKKYLGPYSEGGQAELPGLNKQYGELTSDPSGFMNNIGQNYHQSPGYQFRVQQALQVANHAASAGGMAGSPEEQQGIAGTVNDLANQDYTGWLDHVLGLYGQGLSGQQGIYDAGANASGQLANGLAQGLSSQAANAYAGQQNSNNMFGGLMGAGSTLAGAIASHYANSK